MTTLIFLFLTTLSPQVAEAREPVETQQVEPEVSEALRELTAAREELERAREVLQRDLEERNAELEAMRDKLERLEGQRVQPATDGERVAYGDAVVVAAGERVRDVVAFGDDVWVHGEVAGDATSFGGHVHVEEGGRVQGDAVSFGGRVRVADGGVVEGDRIAMGVPALGAPAISTDAPDAVGSVGSVATPDLLSSLYRRFILLLSFAGAGVLVVGLFPQRVGRIAGALESRPGRSLMVGGLATGFLLVFSLLFAVITFGLGLPVSMVVVAALGLAWLLGFVGLCQVVGDRLPVEQKPHGRWLAFLVGSVLVTFLGSLPLVGWLIVLGASVAGIGAALSTRFGGR